MILVIQWLKWMILFSKTMIFSQMIPSTLSTLMSLSRRGVLPELMSSRMAMRSERQLLTSSVSSKYSSSFSPSRKTVFTVFLSISSTNFCSLLTSSTSSCESSLSEMSHSISGWSSSDCISLRICCLASRKTDILVILKWTMSSLGADLRDSRLRRRSSTAEWQI